MILTFEISTDGTGLVVFFDEEGRDELIARLSECTVPGDHFHLFSGEAAVPGYTITTDEFTSDSKALSCVTIGMPGPGMQPIKDRD